MSFIDKIKVDDIDYDIQDTNSREILDIITPKNVASGRLLHFTDGLPLATFENKVDGNVEQETTTGKQLMDFANISYATAQTTFTMENDIFSISSTAGTTGYKSAYTYITELIKNNSGKILKFYDEGYTSNDISLIPCVQMSVTRSDGTKFYRMLRNYQTNNFDSYTIPSDTSNISEVAFGIYTNNSPNAVANTLTIVKPMLYFDDGTEVEYEKYTGGQASPNPEYPQEIEVIDGDLSVKVNGKNLYGNFIFETKRSGMNIKHNADGTITINGTSTNKIYSIFTNEAKTNNLLIKLKAGTYVLSGGTSNVKLEILKETGETIIATSTTIFKRTFELTETTNVYVRAAIEKGVSLTNQKIFVMLERGNIKTDYEPYQEQIITLDLKGNFVGAINDNIKDYLVTDKKKYWLVKNVGKVVLDDNSTITKRNDGDGSTTMSFNVIPKEKYKVDTPCICNCFINDNSLGSYSSSEVIGVPNNISGIYITILRSRLSSSDENGFKQWLNENNTEVYYVTNKTEIIELDVLEEPIKTFEGTNNIQVIANIDTDIEVKYAVDIKKYTDNKLAEISSQII